MYGATSGGGGGPETPGITGVEVLGAATEAPGVVREAKFFKPRYTTGRVFIGDLYDKVDDYPMHLNPEKPWEKLVSDV